MKKIKKLLSKISKENLKLLDETELLDSYILEKMVAYQSDYSDYVLWEDFKENYLYCDRCKSYQDGQCICYAR